MYKINYPSFIKDKANFEDAFHKSLHYINENAINGHLANINNNGASINFRELICLPFQELLNWRNPISNYSIPLNQRANKITSNAFTDLFDYSKNQPSIANFFMKQEVLDLNTCHYCGIDYINAFKDIGDYRDEIDFLNRADKNDLEKINFIGNGASTKVINARLQKKIVSLVDSGLDKRQQQNVKKFNIGNTHNHFTLDHVLPQIDNKFFSLCLYNLVPSCYSCNSKFKKALNFKTYNSLEQVSPTSASYTLDMDLVFKLYYSGSLNAILSKSDFILDIEELNSNIHTGRYLEMFKLKGRYAYHKNKVLHLIKQKNNYPDSMIKDISSRTGLPIIEVKKLVFGEELFDKLFDNEPLVKLKRNVAKNIGIIDVLD